MMLKMKKRIGKDIRKNLSILKQNIRYQKCVIWYLLTKTGNFVVKFLL